MPSKKDTSVSSFPARDHLLRLIFSISSIYFLTQSDVIPHFSRVSSLRLTAYPIPVISIPFLSQMLKDANFSISALLTNPFSSASIPCSFSMALKVGSGISTISWVSASFFSFVWSFSISFFSSFSSAFSNSFNWASVRSLLSSVFCPSVITSLSYFSFFCSSATGNGSFSGSSALATVKLDIASVPAKRNANSFLLFLIFFSFSPFLMGMFYANITIKIYHFTISLSTL